MFSFVTKKCFSKARFVEINRHICRGNVQCNNYALSCNTQADLLKNEQKWTTGKVLHLKKYNSISTANEDELQQLMAVFSEIEEDLKGPTSVVSAPAGAKWFSELLQHNAANGNKWRALMIMQSYKMLAGHENKTPENLRLVRIMGWCLEFYIASFLIADDIIDGSETRRGVPCWYKRDDVGINAINDSMLLTAGYHALLRKHFQDKPNYAKLLSLLHDAFLKCYVGQSLQLRTAQIYNPKLELFTMERYKSFANYKTSIGTFLLPIELGMCMAGKTIDMQQAEPILYDMGYLHQIQNDFKDCYGDPTVTGKIGTDIEEGLCSWFAVEALERASPKQRQIMEECYGSSDPQKVAAVKELYKELNLPNDYAVHKDNMLNKVQTNIQKISHDQLRKLVHQIFEDFRNRVA